MRVTQDPPTLDPPPGLRTRSLEETEAAHDLLSLSQSLPPLPGPRAVTIPIPSPMTNLTETSSCTYSPTPEQGANIQTSSSVPMTIPYYQPPILYVVQVPTVPTPPTSECSSDAECQVQVNQENKGPTRINM